MTATLNFFPVGNGDMTLAQFEDGQTLLIDCNIRQKADDENDETLDVAKELKKRLDRDDAGRLYVNGMLLSHPDQDHVAGLRNHFHLGPPETWSQDDDKIIINEMWSSPVVFRRASRKHKLVPDAQAWATEARRRVKHYRDHRVASAGDRIKILGEDENGKTDDLEEILVRIDDQITNVDAGPIGVFEANLLAPLPIADEEDKEEALAKNRSSVILQFRITGDSNSDACRYLTGGDAEVAVWCRLWQKHQPFNVDILSYDILLSPHHCSWHCLSYDSWSKNGESAQVDPDARNALSQTREGAVVIASSKPVEDNDSDPPCIRAKREYVDIVEGQSDRFFCLGDNPEDVLEFEIGLLGPQKKRGGLSNIAKSVGVGATSRTPRDHG